MWKSKKFSHLLLSTTLVMALTLPTVQAEGDEGAEAPISIVPTSQGISEVDDGQEQEAVGVTENKQENEGTPKVANVEEGKEEEKPKKEEPKKEEPKKEEPKESSTDKVIEEKKAVFKMAINYGAGKDRVPSFDVVVETDKGKEIERVKVNKSNYDYSTGVITVAVPLKGTYTSGETLRFAIENADKTFESINFVIGSRVMAMRDNNYYNLQLKGYSYKDEEGKLMEGIATLSKDSYFNADLIANYKQFGIQVKTGGVVLKNTEVNITYMGASLKKAKTDNEGYIWVDRSTLPSKFEVEVDGYKNKEVIRPYVEMVVQPNSTSYTNTMDVVLEKMVTEAMKGANEKPDKNDMVAVGFNIKTKSDTRLSDQWLEFDVKFTGDKQKYTVNTKSEKLYVPKGVKVESITSKYATVDSHSLKDGVLTINATPKYTLSIWQEGKPFDVTVVNVGDGIKLKGTDKLTFGIYPGQSFVVKDNITGNYETIYTNADKTITTYIVGKGVVFGGDVNTPHTGDIIYFLVAMLVLMVALGGLSFYLYRKNTIPKPKQVGVMGLIVALLGSSVLPYLPAETVEAGTGSTDTGGVGNSATAKGSAQVSDNIAIAEFLLVPSYKENSSDNVSKYNEANTSFNLAQKHFGDFGGGVSLYVATDNTTSAILNSDKTAIAEYGSGTVYTIGTQSDVWNTTNYVTAERMLKAKNNRILNINNTENKFTSFVSNLVNQIPTQNGRKYLSQSINDKGYGTYWGEYVKANITNKGIEVQQGINKEIVEGYIDILQYNILNDTTLKGSNFHTNAQAKVNEMKTALQNGADFALLVRTQVAIYEKGANPRNHTFMPVDELTEFMDFIEGQARAVSKTGNLNVYKQAEYWELFPQPAENSGGAWATYGNLEFSAVSYMSSRYTRTMKPLRNGLTAGGYTVNPYGGWGYYFLGSAGGYATQPKIQVEFNIQAYDEELNYIRTLSSKDDDNDLANLFEQVNAFSNYEIDGTTIFMEQLMYGAELSDLTQTSLYLPISQLQTMYIDDSEYEFTLVTEMGYSIKTEQVSKDEYRNAWVYKKQGSEYVMDADGTMRIGDTLIGGDLTKYNTRDTLNKYFVKEETLIQMVRNEPDFLDILDESYKICEFFAGIQDKYNALEYHNWVSECAWEVSLSKWEEELAKTKATLYDNIEGNELAIEEVMAKYDAQFKEQTEKAQEKRKKIEKILKEQDSKGFTILNIEPILVEGEYDQKARLTWGEELPNPQAVSYYLSGEEDEVGVGSQLGAVKPFGGLYYKNGNNYVPVQKDLKITITAIAIQKVLCDGTKELCCDPTDENCGGGTGTDCPNCNTETKLIKDYVPEYKLSTYREDMVYNKGITAMQDVLKSNKGKPWLNMLDIINPQEEEYNEVNKYLSYFKDRLGHVNEYSQAYAYINIPTKGDQRTLTPNTNVSIKLDDPNLSNYPWLTSEAYALQNNKLTKNPKDYFSLSKSKIDLVVTGDMLYVRDNDTVDNIKLASWKTSSSLFDKRIGVTSKGEDTAKLEEIKKDTKVSIIYPMTIPTDHNYNWRYRYCGEKSCWWGSWQSQILAKTYGDASYQFITHYYRYLPKVSTVVGVATKEKVDPALVWEARQTSLTLNINPEVTMAFDDNKGNKSTTIVAGDKLRQIKPVHYNLARFVNANIKANVTGTPVATDQKAKVLAQKLGAANKGVVYKGGNTVNSLESEGIVEFKTFALDINNTSLKNSWNPGTTYNTQDVVDEYLGRYGTKGADGKWKVNVTQEGKYKINNKELSGVNKNIQIDEIGRSIVDHELVIRGGVLVSVDGIKVADLTGDLKQAVERMALVGNGNIFTVFEKGTGVKLTEADKDYAHLMDASRGNLGQIKVGNGWYHEDTTVLLLREYTFHFDIPDYQYADKIPMEIQGIATPMDKNQFFSNGYKGHITYKLKLQKLEAKYDSSQATGWGGAGSTDYVVPNVSVLDTFN